MLVHIGLRGCPVLSSEGTVDQLEVTLPREDVGVAVVEAQRDLRPSVGAPVTADDSDLKEAEISRS